MQKLSETGRRDHMITLKQNNLTDIDISFSQAEDFEIEITLDDEPLTGNDVLLFEVAQNDTSANLIEKRFSPVDNAFVVSISDTEKKNLPVGDYIYRMTVNTAAKDVTYISGNLRVNWGA